PSSYLLATADVRMTSFFPVTVAPALSSLSLRDALPICTRRTSDVPSTTPGARPRTIGRTRRHTWGTLARLTHRTYASVPHVWRRDRKSTRLNSSHQIISYAVFCLKKKQKLKPSRPQRN